MTPPASPTLSPQQPAQDASKPPPAENIPASTYQHRTTQSDFTHNDQEALSILAEMSRSLSRGPPSKPAGAIVSAPISTSQHTAHLPLPTARATPIPCRETRAPPPPPSSQSPSLPLVDSHARKSRFATLSSEIDSALWVLYRELESANSLRQQIAELEAQITKLRQDVSIRDNQLILSRRAAEAGRVPQAEIDKLRAEAARGEAAVREAEALRARNEVLEKELREARAETESMSGTLNEWKGKLINLIGS
ncbi:hypothetical protein VTN00DRAFT_8908 [Thermoascus crustaceus]|uniref:uncharacterized protein n=1 Tax=Thermoascus crustaceus TaxID=5088 RepID=UPI0037436EB9